MGKLTLRSLVSIIHFTFKLGLFLIFFTGQSLASSATNGGVGHGLSLTERSENEISDSLIDELPLTINGNYTSRRKVIKTHDFNGDNIADTVVCHIKSNSDNGVEIFDGKSGNLWKSWQVPDYSSGGKTRQFRSCSVAELEPGRSAVFYAGARAGPSGMRYTEYQWFHYRNDNNGISLGMIKKSDGSNYVAAARSVKCTNYPKALVDLGYKPGALCFYAAYDSGLAGGDYGTTTALVKVEYNSGVLTFKDLTASSGLIWVGGMYGTSMNHPNITWKNGLSNNLSMMDGAFIDFNRDGYVDLLTGGAHSDMYEFKMQPDSSKTEGFKFSKTKLEYSYIYKLQTLSETEKHLDSNCVFVGDSTYRGSPGRQNYLKCYKNNKWVRANLPGGSVHAGDSPINVLADGDGKIFIHIPDPDDGTGPQYYSINFKDDVLSYYLGIQEESNRLVVVGYVCRKNKLNQDINLALTSKKTSGEANYKVYRRMASVDQALNIKQQPKCLAKDAVAGKIKYEVFKSDLVSLKGKIWVRINHPELQNIIKGLNYDFTD